MRCGGGVICCCSADLLLLRALYHQICSVLHLRLFGLFASGLMSSQSFVSEVNSFCLLGPFHPVFNSTAGYLGDRL